MSAIQQQMRGALPYDRDRQIKGMLKLADELRLSGFHHLPAHAAAMELALGKAHTAFSGNNVGAALVALGAFWDIFGGRLREHPEYEGRETVRMAANKLPLERVTKYLETHGWMRCTIGPGNLVTFGKTDNAGNTTKITLPTSDDYEPTKCKAFIDAAITTIAAVEKKPFGCVEDFVCHGIATLSGEINPW